MPDRAKSDPSRLVLFDMDDVVYHYDRARRVAFLAAETGLSPDWIAERVWVSGLEDSADLGVFAVMSDYMAAISAALGKTVSLELWLAARKAAMTPIEGTLAIISGLCAMPDVAVGVLTNNGPLVREHRTTLVPELARLVPDRFHVSADFLSRKPDPGIFRALIARQGFPPEACFFIDDLAVNVEGAQKAGLAAHQFISPERLADALRGFGLYL